MKEREDISDAGSTPAASTSMLTNRRCYLIPIRSGVIALVFSMPVGAYRFRRDATSVLEAMGRRLPPQVDIEHLREIS